MKELGFVVTKTGSIIKFGEYNCYAYRDNDNKEHFHNSSFREKAKQDRQTFSFINDVENFEIVHNLNFMAQNNCVSLLNSTQGRFESYVPMAVMTVPKNLSLIQKKTLISMKEKINYFDGGLLYVDVIDSDGQIVSEYNSVSDFYSQYLGINSQTQQESVGCVRALTKM